MVMRKVMAVTPLSPVLKPIKIQTRQPASMRNRCRLRNHIWSIRHSRAVRCGVKLLATFWLIVCVNENFFSEILNSPTRCLHNRFPSYVQPTRVTQSQKIAQLVYCFQRKLQAYIRCNFHNYPNVRSINYRLKYFVLLNFNSIIFMFIMWYWDIFAVQNSRKKIHCFCYIFGIHCCVCTSHNTRDSTVCNVRRK